MHNIASLAIICGMMLINQWHNLYPVTFPIHIA